MKRTELIENLTKLYKSIPKDASPYHIVDILIGKAERMGMKPPINNLLFNTDGDYVDANNLTYHKWEDEDEA